MFESLFGAEMPLAIRFFLAFVFISLPFFVVSLWLYLRGTSRCAKSI